MQIIHRHVRKCAQISECSFKGNSLPNSGFFSGALSCVPWSSWTDERYSVFRVKNLKMNKHTWRRILHDCNCVILSQEELQCLTNTFIKPLNLYDCTVMWLWGGNELSLNVQQSFFKAPTRHYLFDFCFLFFLLADSKQSKLCFNQRTTEQLLSSGCETPHFIFSALP